MTTDQTILFSLIGALFVFLIWGRYRYDLVAFGALLLAYLMGVVPTEEVFSGFGHPTVVIIALVLIISRGLYLSGAIEMMASALHGMKAKSSGIRRAVATEHPPGLAILFRDPLRNPDRPGRAQQAFGRIPRKPRNPRHFGGRAEPFGKPLDTTALNRS